MKRIVLVMVICLLAFHFCYADEIQLRLVLTDEEAADTAFDLLELDKHEKLRIGKDVLLSLSNNPDVDKAEIGRTKYGFLRLEVYLNDAGKKKFLNLTKKYLRQRIAFVFNNQILTVLYIKKPVKDGVILIQNHSLLGAEAGYNMLVKSMGFACDSGVNLECSGSPLFGIETKDAPLGMVPLDGAQKLAEEGAFVKSGDDNRWTILMLAAYQNDIELVEYLISKGADVNACNSYGKTALMMLAERRDVDNLALAKMLISNQADIDLRDEGGRTAFMFAIGEDNYKMADFLLLNGANVNVKDISGDNALIYYASNYEGLADKKIVDFLILKGIDINAQNNLGKTALMMAAKRDNYELVQYLCEKGADVGIKDVNGMTALMWAASRERQKIVEYLGSRSKS